MHPYITGTLADQHQHNLINEAEHERFAKKAHIQSSRLRRQPAVQEKKSSPMVSRTRAASSLS